MEAPQPRDLNRPTWPPRWSDILAATAVLVVLCLLVGGFVLTPWLFVGAVPALGPIVWAIRAYQLKKTTTEAQVGDGTVKTESEFATDAEEQARLLEAGHRRSRRRQRQ